MQATAPINVDTSDDDDAPLAPPTIRGSSTLRHHRSRSAPPARTPHSKRPPTLQNTTAETPHNGQ
eukprot:5976425-Prorocentrum_lima.AAC.1